MNGATYLNDCSCVMISGSLVTDNRHSNLSEFVVYNILRYYKVSENEKKKFTAKLKQQEVEIFALIKSDENYN